MNNPLLKEFLDPTSRIGKAYPPGVLKTQLKRLTVLLGEEFELTALDETATLQEVILNLGKAAGRLAMLNRTLRAIQHYQTGYILPRWPAEILDLQECMQRSVSLLEDMVEAFAMKGDKQCTAQER